MDPLGFVHVQTLHEPIYAVIGPSEAMERTQIMVDTLDTHSRFEPFADPITVLLTALGGPFFPGCGLVRFESPP